MTRRRHTTVLNLSAVYAAVWGLFVLWPGNDLFASMPRLYAPMLSLVPYEAFWGSLAIIAGLAAAVYGYAHRRTGQLIMFAFYTSVAALFVLGDVTRPSWAIFIVLALFNLMQWRANGWKDGNG